jgi:metal-dependent amidase/aminoacylase/carboxypeptidase family protein
MSIRQIHGNPELSHKEFLAHDLLTTYLEKKGFKVTRKACGLETAFIAEFETTANPNYTVGFLSEYVFHVSSTRPHFCLDMMPCQRLGKFLTLQSHIY